MTQRHSLAFSIVAVLLALYAAFTAQRTPDTLIARRVILVDAEGEPWAVLGPQPTAERGLCLMGEAGGACLTLAYEDGAPSLSLMHDSAASVSLAAERGRAVISATAGQGWYTSVSQGEEPSTITIPAPPPAEAGR